MRSGPADPEDRHHRAAGPRNRGRNRLEPRAITIDGEGKEVAPRIRAARVGKAVERDGIEEAGTTSGEDAGRPPTRKPSTPGSGGRRSLFSRTTPVRRAEATTSGSQPTRRHPQTMRPTTTGPPLAGVGTLHGGCRAAVGELCGPPSPAALKPPSNSAPLLPARWTWLVRSAPAPPAPRVEAAGRPTGAATASSVCAAGPGRPQSSLLVGRRD